MQEMDGDRKTVADAFTELKYWEWGKSRDVFFPCSPV